MGQVELFEHGAFKGRHRLRAHGPEHGVTLGEIRAGTGDDGAHPQRGHCGAHGNHGVQPAGTQGSANPGIDGKAVHGNLHLTLGGRANVFFFHCHQVRTGECLGVLFQYNLLIFHLSLSLL